MRLVVVGGGVSGLAAAHRAIELDPEAEVTVLEGADRAGGVVRTERTGDGYVIEHGPDAIITDKPWALALARRLGLEDRVVGTRPEHRGAYVLCRGRLERVPEGFALMAPVRVGPFLRSPILSWRGKSRAALDLVLPRGREEDESLASFVRRRFGQEVLDRLAQPLIGGIYGADPERLSLRATMPRFLDVEERSRSVAFGLWRRRRAAGAKGAASGARYGLFISFRDGIQTLTDALADRLGDRVRLGAPVREVARRDGGWRVGTESGDAFEADAVVLAVPAHRAAGLVEPLDGELASLLRGVRTGASAAVTLAYPRDRVGHPLDAYGFVVPAVEGRQALAATWASRKWPGRAPEGMELFRVFLGGAGKEGIVHRDDDALVELARRELEPVLSVEAGTEPALVRTDRWRGVMPQYEVGHLRRVDAIEARTGDLPGLFLAGNSYRGVGVPDSVHRGEQMAERALAVAIGASPPGSAGSTASSRS